MSVTAIVSYTVMAFVIPGLLLGRAWGLRFPWATAASIPLTFGMTGLMGWGYHLIGIRYNLGTAVSGWLLALLAGIVLQLTISRVRNYWRSRKNRPWGADRVPSVRQAVDRQATASHSDIDSEAVADASGSQSDTVDVENQPGRRGSIKKWIAARYRAAREPGALLNPEWIIPLAGVISGATIMLATGIKWTNRTSAGLNTLFQGWDPQWHANVLRYIDNTGVASPAAMGQLQNIDLQTPMFYPTGWHTGSYLLMPMLGLNPIEALNVAAFVIPGLCFPVAAAVLTWRLVDRRGLTQQIAAALAAVAVAWVPVLAPIGYGIGAWPFVAAMAMAPIAAGLIMGVPQRPQRAPMAALAFLGVGEVHTAAALFVVALVAVWWLLWRVWVPSTAHSAHRPTTRKAIGSTVKESQSPDPEDDTEVDAESEEDAEVESEAEADAQTGTATEAPAVTSTPKQSATPSSPTPEATPTSITQPVKIVVPSRVGPPGTISIAVPTSTDADTDAGSEAHTDAGTDAEADTEVQADTEPATNAKPKTDTDASKPSSAPEPPHPTPIQYRTSHTVPGTNRTAGDTDNTSAADTDTPSRMRRIGRGIGRRLHDMLWLAIAGGLGALLLLPQVTVTKTQQAEIQEFTQTENVSRDQSWIDGLQLLTRHAADYGANWILLWGAIIGGIILLLWRRNTWGLALWFMALVLTVHAERHFSGAWGDFFNLVGGYFYNAGPRLVMIVAYFVVAAAAIGAAAVGRFILLGFVHLIENDKGGRSLRILSGVLAIIGGVLGGYLLTPQVWHDNQAPNKWAMVSFRDDRVISQADLAAFDWLASQRSAHDGMIIGDPSQGYGWMYARNNLTTLHRHYLLADTPEHTDGAYLHWNSGELGRGVSFDKVPTSGKLSYIPAPDQPNAVDAAARRKHVRFVYVSPPNFWDFQKPIISLMEDLFSSPGVTMVYANDEVRIFAVNDAFTDSELKRVRESGEAASPDRDALTPLRTADGATTKVNGEGPYKPYFHRPGFVQMWPRVDDSYTYPAVKRNEDEIGYYKWIAEIRKEQEAKMKADK